jgi:hypothetical protein
MDAYLNVPSDEHSLFIDWHARLIRDPVSRLRYLRHVVQPDLPARPYARRHNLASRAAALILVVLTLPLATGHEAEEMVKLQPLNHPVTAKAPEAVPEVWLVDVANGFETYSNGLRVDTRFTVRTNSRSYRAILRNSAGALRMEIRFDPAGIVFHTTESRLFAFQAARTSQLKAASQGVLDFVRRNQSYHFVIDRFGQVYRIVRETDVANHAGRSVWADEDFIYLNLNESFLGIAFEARNQTEDGFPSVTPAQIHAGRVLTEMLRSKYRIKAGNCIAHAQVSVNPSGHLIAYHTDWATHLPYRELGLPDNYQEAIPSICLFGFRHDAIWDGAGVDGLGKGIQAGEAVVREQARRLGKSVEAHRRLLWQRYRELIQALGQPGAPKERSS